VRNYEEESRQWLDLDPGAGSKACVACTRFHDSAVRRGHSLGEDGTLSIAAAAAFRATTTSSFGKHDELPRSVARSCGVHEYLLFIRV
jgi:hypothetical protein